jgi:2C-methyl-D-erythritol 2,4-cyclodiphosphate synthase
LSPQSDKSDKKQNNQTNSRLFLSSALASLMDTAIRLKPVRAAIRANRIKMMQAMARTQARLCND